MQVTVQRASWPHLYGDYTIETVGHEVVLAAGGRVAIVPTVEGFSTTNIVRKLNAQEPAS